LFAHGFRGFVRVGRRPQSHRKCREIPGRHRVRRRVRQLGIEDFSVRARAGQLRRARVNGGPKLLAASHRVRGRFLHGGHGGRAGRQHLVVCSRTLQYGRQQNQPKRRECSEHNQVCLCTGASPPRLESSRGPVPNDNVADERMVDVTCLPIPEGMA
jgi:hypothetical protein